ncbi:hypothetical protein GKC30_08895 [Pseudodesulfovibrio sp. F-1]|uniref:Uncharacterized protein n=1 Tax=Pseudodesulfovibrio alkaliphilus TaxID=2661613 RepID=A0A7K1KP18_9BACT|nr:hypothetical protein [Pseudodesulfovibrio alkaliphilus]MUM77750.1 hypothetical protein [Pseudodesulfovibrio alkaliphilus]
MAKTISISIPEELFTKLRNTNQSFKISQICQRALESEIMEKETLAKARKLGIEDGDKAKSTLTNSSRMEIKSAFERSSQKWSSEELYKLADKLQSSLSSEDLEMLQPRFNQIFDGELILSDWMKHRSGKTIQDKWSEVAWAYVEGTYLGLTQKHLPKEAPSVKESQAVLAEIQRVQTRVPRWFNNPSQINSRILIEFLSISDSGDRHVSIDELKKQCKIKTFDTNFAQMKIFGERNHGKVFDVIDGKVTLWSPVKDFIKIEFDKYKKLGLYRDSIHLTPPPLAG